METMETMASNNNLDTNTLEYLVEYFKQQHSITYTPAGKWEYIDGKKSAIDAKRYDNLNWDRYPNDNMARTKLPNGIVVLDLDGLPSTITGSEIYIPALEVTLPLGLYTVTSHPQNVHIYYSITQAQQQVIGQKMIKGLYGLKIDVIQNYVLFEGHPSEYQQLHEGNILPIPQTLIDIVSHYIEENDIPSASTDKHLAIHSNKQRANLVKDYLAKKLSKRTQLNNFFKATFPREYIRKGAKNLLWSEFQLDYDLMNKIAVKLTTTAELDYHEHVVPALDQITRDLGKDPEHSRAKKAWAQILPSLPHHEAIFQYEIDDDDNTLQQLIEQQPLTQYPVFKTVWMGKVRYINMDRHSHYPISHNGSQLFDEQAARALHPEREWFDEQTGKSLGWDGNVPIVELITDPFAPSYQVDEHSRHQINLLQPTKFVRNAAPRTSTNNLLSRLVRSVIHPDYLLLVETYLAHIVFSNTSPIMVLWIATRSSEAGGTGKSMVSITILGKILQSQAATISDETMGSGYDVSQGIRLLSMEEGSTDGAQHKRTYQAIKQFQSPTYTKANAKYGAMESKIIKMAITGSSNQLPSLEASDRRYLCIEPAHLDHHTKPLSQADASLLAQFEQNTSTDFDDLIQEYTNHLYAIYLEPLKQDIEEAMYMRAPDTMYRKDWIVGALSNVKTIIHNLPFAEELHASIHMNRIDTGSDLTDILTYMLHMHNPDAGKMSISWKMFTILIPLIASDADIDLTKSNIKRMLGDIKLQPGSGWAIVSHKASNFPSWPQDMYTFNIDDIEVSKYRKLLAELYNPVVSLEDIS